MDISIASQPIGIFDSGVGGLTVMQKLMEVLPRERFIYFGDTARLPYGNKSQELIERYAIESAIYLIKKNIKLLVIACNTVSAHALLRLRELFKIPIIGVIEPAAKQAVSMTKSEQIGVLGTKATIESGVYQNTIRRLCPNASVFPIACPLLVSLIEERWLDHMATRLIVREYLHPLKNQSIDTILLGCTHYPLLRGVIQEEVGNHVTLVDSASNCAIEIETLLKEQGWLSPIFHGYHQYYVSADPQKFRLLAEKLFAKPMEHIELYSSDPLQYI